MKLTKAFTDAEYDAKIRREDTEFEVFIDMDGVLSDYIGHVKKQGKMQADGKTPDWKKLDYKWWVSMPSYPGMKRFFSLLKTIGNTNILTAPSASPDSLRGKADWVEEKWDSFALKDLITASARNKKFLAGPKRILIDDDLRNVEDWRKAGGIGIHHAGSYTGTLKKVRTAVRAARQQSQPAPSRLNANLCQ